MAGASLGRSTETSRYAADTTLDLRALEPGRLDQDISRGVPRVTSEV